MAVEPARDVHAVQHAPRRRRGGRPLRLDRRRDRGAAAAAPAWSSARTSAGSTCTAARRGSSTRSRACSGARRPPPAKRFARPAAGAAASRPTGRSSSARWSAAARGRGIVRHAVVTGVRRGLHRPIGQRHRPHAGRAALRAVARRCRARAPTCLWAVCATEAGRRARLALVLREAADRFLLVLDADHAATPGRSSFDVGRALGLFDGRRRGAGAPGGGRARRMRIF